MKRPVYVKPPVQPLPRYRDDEWYKMATGRCFVAAGIVLLIIIIVVA
jgi:hypothetical protein